MTLTSVCDLDLCARVGEGGAGVAAADPPEQAQLRSLPGARRGHLVRGWRRPRAHLLQLLPHGQYGQGTPGKCLDWENKGLKFLHCGYLMTLLCDLMNYNKFIIIS